MNIHAPNSLIMLYIVIYLSLGSEGIVLQTVTFDPIHKKIFVKNDKCVRSSKFIIDKYSKYPEIQAPHDSTGYFLNISDTGCLITTPYMFTEGSQFILIYSILSLGIDLKIHIGNNVFEPYMNYTGWGTFITAVSNETKKEQVKFIMVKQVGTFPSIIIDRFQITHPTRSDDQALKSQTFKTTSKAGRTVATSKKHKFKQKQKTFGSITTAAGSSKYTLKDTLDEKTPVKEKTVEKTPIEELPVEETPIEELPVEETPIEELPVEKTPIEEPQFDETPKPRVNETQFEEVDLGGPQTEEQELEKSPVGEFTEPVMEKENVIPEQKLKPHMEYRDYFEYEIEFFTPPDSLNEDRLLNRYGLFSVVAVLTAFLFALLLCAATLVLYNLESCTEEELAA